VAHVAARIDAGDDQLDLRHESVEREPDAVRRRAFHGDLGVTAPVHLDGFVHGNVVATAGHGPVRRHEQRRAPRRADEPLEGAQAGRIDPVVIR